MMRAKHVVAKESHGESNGGGVRSATKEYAAWVNLRNRCCNPNAAQMAYYSGRGIVVCERWGSYEMFLADVGRAPFPDSVLDRIDNDGPYAPGNVRWVDLRTQMLNRRAWGGGTKGVRQRGGSFSPYICVAGRNIFLGSFSTLEAALEVRLEAEREFYGFNVPR